MSAYISIILTITFAVIVNARYERAAYIPQLDLPKNINPDDFYNEMKYADSRGGYIESWPQWSKEYQESVPGLVRIYENSIHSDEMRNNNSPEDQYKSAEAPPEPLPIPLALNNELKTPAYKKNNNNYYMTLCHFKICNMGRKRDTRYLHLSELMEKLHEKPNNLGRRQLAM